MREWGHFLFSSPWAESGTTRRSESTKNLTPARNGINSRRKCIGRNNALLAASCANDSGPKMHAPLTLPAPMSPQLTPTQPAPRPPTITVLIPGSLRKYCDDTSELAVEAPSLRAVLEELERRFPALHRNVC